MALESDYIRWLRQQLPSDRQLRLGLADDAALLESAPGTELVITTDLLCQGVHFRLEDTMPEKIGRKALAVNLSDLAAMAAQPVAAFVSLLLPQAAGIELAKMLTLGMQPLAEQFGVAIAGGDTNSWPGSLVINVTAIGYATPDGPLLRGGARPGDVLIVTGSLGGSILGHHLDFTPRINEALALNANYELHAGMDLSDGLALDVRRMAAESRCGVEIEATAVPISGAARKLASDGSSPLDHALGDGEDFELLLAVPPAEAERLLQDQPLDVPLTAVGRCLEDRSLWLRTEDGTRQPLPELGYQHRFQNEDPSH